MNQRTKLLREIALIADQEDVREKAQDLGKLAASTLGKKKRSQITGLETLASSTQRVTDIFNYIKTRTARQEEWQASNLGDSLLTYLEGDMRGHRDAVFQRLQSQQITLDAYEQQAAYLELLRAFIDQFAAHYEYACLTTGGDEEK